MHRKLFSIIYKYITYIINTIINIKYIFYSFIDCIINIYGLYMYIIMKYIESYICNDIKILYIDYDRQIVTYKVL